MTGFGKSSLELSDKSISIEIKSLNSKQFDAYLRLPPLYREKDAEIRQMLTAGLIRGKVEVNINVDNNGEQANFNFNRALAKQYFEEIKSLSSEIGLELSNDVISTLVKMPDVLKAEQAGLSEEEWKSVSISIRDAMDKLNDFRVQEGKTLENKMIFCNFVISWNVTHVFLSAYVLKFKFHVEQINIYKLRKSLYIANKISKMKTDHIFGVTIPV